MSFFEDDEPTTVQRESRPRRSASARRGGGGDGADDGGRGGGADAQTLRTRRLVAAGLGLLLLVLLILIFNACQDSRRKNALRDYNREASDLVTQSDTQVGRKFFETLGQGSSQSPEDLQTTVSSLRAEADTELKRAKNLSTPGDLDAAQQSLLIALELRRDGLQYVAKRIATALGNEGDVADRAIEGIAGEMQAFSASDTLIRARVTPLVRDTLSSNDVVADPVSTAGFLPSLDWLQPSFVADQLGTRISNNGSGRQTSKTVAPGLHGTGLTGTTVDGVALQPDPASNRVPASGDLVFSVKFSNQGENDEFDVPVAVTLEGQGKPITGKDTVAQVAQGADATAEVKLSSKPRTGEVYTVTVKVGAVPGEKKTDNNTSTYNVLFQ